MPDRDHPIWIIGIMAVITAALGLMLKYNYRAFDERDVTTMVTVAVAYLAAVAGKRKALAMSEDKPTKHATVRHRGD